MSTHSSIAVVHKDGTVSACYVHFDGYIDGVGSRLQYGFNSREGAESLIALGDLSSIEAKGNVCAYSRDRHEKYEDVKPHKYADIKDYFNKVTSEIDDSGYRYIFMNGHWRVWGDPTNDSQETISVRFALGNISKEK
jgi:hypothetical protein